jgi:hypothetical protein
MDVRTTDSPSSRCPKEAPISQVKRVTSTANTSRVARETWFDR